MTEKTLFQRLDDIERDLDGDNWITDKYMRKEEGYVGVETALVALFPLVDKETRMQLQRIIARAERLHYSWGESGEGDYSYYLDGRPMDRHPDCPS